MRKRKRIVKKTPIFGMARDFFLLFSKLECDWKFSNERMTFKGKSDRRFVFIQTMAING
jgi:hypothetical protein